MVLKIKRQQKIYYNVSKLTGEVVSESEHPEHFRKPIIKMRHQIPEELILERWYKVKTKYGNIDRCERFQEARNFEQLTNL